MTLEYKIEIREPVSSPSVHVFYRMIRRTNWTLVYEGSMPEFMSQYRECFAPYMADINETEPYSVLYFMDTGQGIVRH